jgi:hypothetical protein
MRELINIILIAAALISPILIKSITIKQSKRLLTSAIGLISSAILVSIFLFGTFYAENYFESSEIEKLDIDKDGFYTAIDEATWTQSDREMISRYYNDGGGNAFAVILFPIFSIIYTSIIWGFRYIIEVIRK